MNKKIKFIELVNRISNGEEVPKKIKYLNRIYKFYKGEKDYISYDDEETKWCGQTLLFNIMEWHHITELLEAEVEILEDNTEEIILTEKIFVPMELNLTDYDKNLINNCFESQNALINQLVRAVNKLRKESEDEQ